MKESESRDYFVYRLPTLKGICILGVLLIHVVDPTRMKPDQWVATAAWLVNSLARFAVPLFFVFSGFSLSLSGRNVEPIRFYRRTLKHILVPYVIYSLIYSVPLLWETQDRLRLVGKDLLEGSAYYHLWFAPALIRTYVIHPFLIRYYRTLRRPGFLVLASLVVPIFWPSVLSSVQRTFPSASLPLGWLLGSSTNWGMAFPTYVGFSILGYYLFQHAENIRRAQRRSVVLPALLVWTSSAVGIAALGLGPSSADSDQARSLLVICLTVAASLVISAFVQQLANYRPVYRGVLHSFGLYSYGVYYIHPAWLYVTRRLLVQVIGIQFENPLLYPLLFGLTSVATLQTVRVLARSPVGKYLT